MHLFVEKNDSAFLRIERNSFYLNTDSTVNDSSLEQQQFRYLSDDVCLYHTCR